MGRRHVSLKACHKTHMMSVLVHFVLHPGNDASYVALFPCVAWHLHLMGISRWAAAAKREAEHPEFLLPSHKGMSNRRR